MTANLPRFFQKTDCFAQIESFIWCLGGPMTSIVYGIGCKRNTLLSVVKHVIHPAAIYYQFWAWPLFWVSLNCPAFPLGAIAAYLPVCYVWLVLPACIWMVLQGLCLNRLAAGMWMIQYSFQLLCDWAMITCPEASLLNTLIIQLIYVSLLTLSATTCFAS